MFLLQVFNPLLAQTQLTNIPTIYITTENNTPITSKTIYLNGKITIKSTDPNECITDSTIKIRGRGNATWNMAKKSYRIKFPDNTRILSMPAKENSWVMLANYADKTLIRNAVAFEIGRALGMEYTPPVRYADVYLNGDFIGNYLITDQLDVDKNRVNVEKLDSMDTMPPDITGGYLMEINGTIDTNDDPYYVKTGKGLNVIVKYPDEDDINQQQFAYITNFVNDFETTLFSSYYSDPASGYRAWVDTTELVNWYLACELTGNSDSFWSTYWHKKRSINQVIFGPLWDFDIAFNNDNRLGDATQKLMRVSGFNPKAWITQFASDSWFLKKVYQRFLELKDSGLLDRLITYIDEEAIYLNASQQKNFARWDILNTVVYRELAARGTYQAEIDFLKNYVVNRFAYLESQLKIVDPPVYTSTVESGYFYSIINKKTGKAIDVQNASTSENSLAVLYTYDETKASQQWKFISTSTSGVYVIQNKNSGLALQNDGKSGSQLTLVTNTNSQYQQWKIVSVDNFYAGIQNVLTNQYSINNKGGSSADNNPIIEYTNNISGSENQQWTFVKQGSIYSAVSDQIVDAEKLQVYPNPAVDIATLYYHTYENSSARLSIFTIDGRQMFAKNITTDNSGDFIYKLDMNEIGIKSGVYIIKVSTDEGQWKSVKLFVK